MGILVVLSISAKAEPVKHNLKIELQPDQSVITIIDNLQLPSGIQQAVFSLNKNLRITVEGGKLVSLSSADNNHRRYYQLSRLSADGKVQLKYQGKIATTKSRDLAGMPDTVFNKDSIYLDGNSGWYPQFSQHPWQTFNMEINVPQDWQIISQGKRIEKNASVSYSMPYPQDDIYLLGGRYQRYARLHNDIELEVYLLEEDARLAKQYLDKSAQYLALYSQWIGPYPYAKFAVIENAWQTGYGMPSFTLLGSQVIRLPFILYTSLPHEILHNWWGNGVFINFENGNWSEGLTAYMADHFNSEQRGTDAAYRRKALERYANFASKQRDFPIAEFTSRHSEASQAIGYSKSLMLFHMLRKLAGDEQFKQGIQHFWQQYQFKDASFHQLIEQLHTGSEAEIADFLRQWIFREGAPELRLTAAEVTASDKGFDLSISVSQNQDGEIYQLQIPVKVLLENEHQAIWETVTLSEKNQDFSFSYPAKPKAVELDPQYDIFRLLAPGERPSTLGRLFGASKQLLVYPAAAPAQQQQAWQQLAEAWNRQFGNLTLVKDTGIEKLPADTAIWLVGWNNRLLKDRRMLFSSDAQQLRIETAVLNQQTLAAGEQAVVLLDPNNNRNPLAFIGARSPETISLLARKLPHYKSYGALAFTENTASNIIKQHLQVISSPMQIKLD